MREPLRCEKCGTEWPRWSFNAKANHECKGRLIIPLQNAVHSRQTTIENDRQAQPITADVSDSDDDDEFDANDLFIRIVSAGGLKTEAVQPLLDLINDPRFREQVSCFCVFFA